MFKRILVSLDGSDLAEQAMPVAGQLARTFDAEVVLVRVAEERPLQTRLSMDAVSYQDVIDAADAVVTTYLAEVAGHSTLAGTRVTTVMLHGDPARQITSHAVAGDLILMTSHGRTGVTRWMMGSVAESIVRRASVSVMVHRVGPGLDEASTDQPG